MAEIILVENLTFFFSIFLTKTNIATKIAINDIVFILVINKNSLKNVLSILSSIIS